MTKHRFPPGITCVCSILISWQIMTRRAGVPESTQWNLLAGAKTHCWSALLEARSPLCARIYDAEDLGLGIWFPLSLAAINHIGAKTLFVQLLLIHVVFFLLPSESWHWDLCPHHHPRQGERGGLHNALHGLLGGRAAAQGREDSGHVCLPGPLWPLPVGLHCWHGALGGAPGLPLELAQPPAPSDGIHDVHNSLQLHVVCLWILCAAR